MTAASSNDALDVISEYLLQNGEIGATKLPLVKELRSFLMSQTNIENGALNNNNNATSSLNPNTNTNTSASTNTSTNSTSANSNSNSNNDSKSINSIITGDTDANSLLLGNLPILAPGMGANGKLIR